MKTKRKEKKWKENMLRQETIVRLIIKQLSNRFSDERKIDFSTVLERRH